MIADTLDLEQLLTQYESEAVLVGPVLSLSVNTSYRYLYLAGNGRKVYQSIDLGFLENEWHAQNKRADIVEKLKPWFAELVLFDSHTEMARAAHTRWRTEETARVLAAVEREAKAASAPPADYETISERGDGHTLADEQCGGVPHDLLEHHQSTRRVNQASSAEGASVAEEQRPFTLDQGGQLGAQLGAAPERAKLTGQESPKNHSYQKGFTSKDQFRQLVGTLFDDGSGKPADMMAELQGSARLGLNHVPTKGAGRNDANDNGPSKDANHITRNRTRELFEDTGRGEGGTIRLPPAATLPPLPKECGEAPPRQNQQQLGLTQDDIASAIPKLGVPAQPDNCSISPVEPCRSLPESLTLTVSDIVPKHTRGRSTFLLLAIVLFWTFVLPSTREGVDKIGNAQLAQVTNLPSKSAAEGPPLPMSQPANAIASAQQADAAPRTLSSAATASRGESSGSDAALVSDRHELVAQQERTGDLSEAKAIAKLVDRGMESLKSGDLESARVSLQRAVEAIPGTAAVPSQVEPSRSVPLQGTSQALVVEPSPQNEYSPPIKSSSNTRHSARVANPKPGFARSSGQVAPAQKKSTIRHLDPDEIAILLSRGMESLKSCNLETAQVSLRRAVEAIPGKVAVPAQVEPSRSMPLRGTSQALAVQQSGPQHERSSQIKSSSDARHSARVGSLKPGVALGNGQVAPAQKNSTVRHLDPDEIEILLGRGMESLKSCNLVSARASLGRAVEAIPATAAVPSQVEPSRSMPLQGTSQALAVKQPSPQNEHSPQIKSSSDASHSMRVALESARVSPRRDVEAIPGRTTAPLRVEPSRSMPLQGTSQALAVKQPSPQNEHSPQIKSSLDARRLARVASLEPKVEPGGGQVAPAQKNSTIRHIDQDEIVILLSRGMDFLKSGDFASARVTLRRAAEAGNAEAALALATTYDPSVLRQLGAVGIAANVAEAREWYEEAVKLGSAAAAQGLARLAQLSR